MKLSQPVKYTNKIIPICLFNVDNVKIGNRAVVTGWVSIFILFSFLVENNFKFYFKGEIWR
jgi:hypothetical protein